ncbi:MAG: prenyltransferase/squalene oxidase repeat-containing protein [Fimbriiglobus sp.]
MSTPVPPVKPSPDGKPAASPAAVIRRIQGAEETAHQRLMKKHIPAWVISGAVHVMLIAVLITLDKLMPAPVVLAQEEMLAVVTDEKPPDDKKEDLTNPEAGLEPELPSAVEVDKLADANVVTEVVPDQPPGVDSSEANKPVDINPPAGVGPTDAMAPGLTDVGGEMPVGDGGGNGSVMSDGMRGRSGATRNRLLKSGGGNAATEVAVARGIIWLASKQKKNGSWVYDSTNTDYNTKFVVASTGMALLPFLAAGNTHKPFDGNKYQKNVEAGLRFLTDSQREDGSFAMPDPTRQYEMYVHAIATVAICEAYGMTGDKKLLGRAQKAISYICAAQAADGSWGYNPKISGDTSIVGWQIQALQSGKLCKDIVIPKGVFDKARGFLDKVADADKKATYGYKDRNPTTPTLSAIGLLTRYYVDGWGPNNQSMAAGVKYLLDSQQPNNAMVDMYYLYYATQVIHFFDGPEWHKTWNPKMRDLMVERQVGQDKPNAGSWDPDNSRWIGGHCGRLGTTCMSLLSLEVYYRHLPLYKRDTAGMRDLEMTK